MSTNQINIVSMVILFILRMQTAMNDVVCTLRTENIHNSIVVCNAGEGPCKGLGFYKIWPTRSLRMMLR